MDFITFLSIAILGAISWTLLEYLLHRFLGHELKGKFRRFIFFKEHMKHHHKKNYFASLKDKVLISLGIGFIVFTISIFLGGELFAAVYTLSFITMYYIYEIIHRRLHLTAPAHSFAAKMRAHHFYHHFVNAKVNYGVTCAIWDRVFGTYKKARFIPIPRKYSIDWISDLYKDKAYVDKFGHHYKTVDK